LKPAASSLPLSSPLKTGVAFEVMARRRVARSALIPVLAGLALIGALAAALIIL
jgi:hypothetical protein